MILLNGSGNANCFNAQSTTKYISARITSQMSKLISAEEVIASNIVVGFNTLTKNCTK